MGLFSKKKPEAAPAVPEAAPVVAQQPPPNPFPEAPRRLDNPYADSNTFVPVSARAAPAGANLDPLQAAQLKTAARDAEILDAIFHAFGRQLPEWGTQLKKWQKMPTSHYEFNEGNFDKRYKDFERMIQDYMEERGWKVKEFSIRNSKEKSKVSTLLIPIAQY